MTDNLPAPSGGYLSGTVVPASQDQGDVKAHAFFNVVRDLLHRATYKSEADLDAALNTVDNFERHYLSGSLSSVVSEGDRAPREDVTQRVAPPVGTVPVTVAGPAIDYNKLAAAIVAVQQQQLADQQAGKEAS